MLNLIAAIQGSRTKDLFTVRLSVALLLMKLGITGAVASFLGYWIRGALGLFIDLGILKVDLVLDAIREGAKLSEFNEGAEELYNRVTKGIKSETEKQAIRKEYLETIRKIGFVGKPK